MSSLARSGRWMLVLLLAVVGGRGALATPPNAPALQASLVLSDSQAGLDGPGVTSFNLVYVRDLWIRVRVPSLRGVAVEKVELVAPQGDVFYRDVFRFSADQGVTHVPGKHHPLAVLQAKPLHPGFALDQSIPIAGSVFQRYPDPGSWRIDVTVAGIPATMSKRVQFSMTR